MKLDEKQIEQIKKEIGEKRFNDILNPDPVYSSRKIYLYRSSGDTYKLQVISHNPNLCYAFISLDDSECWANGEHSSAIKALKSVSNFEVFDSMKHAISSGYFN